MGIKLHPGHEDFCMNDIRIKEVKDRAIEYLKYIIDICPEKIIFGSDYGSLNIREHFELVLDSGMKENEINKILYENANNIYKLGL